MLNREQLLKNKPLIIAGPCSISSKKQIIKIASNVKKAGAHAVRAQLWKPRTNPNSFQGVGEKGIKWVKELRDKVDIPIAMEVMTEKHVDMVKDLADILWIGTRNMQNFDLLRRVGEEKHAVILKRGLIATVKEWLSAADYIGREKVILCERGIRTGADSMRFTLDLNSVLVAKHDHNMPVIVDPSHAAGRRDIVPSLAYAAIAVGADGVVVETHTNPEEEQVDKDQTIAIETFEGMMKKIKDVYGIVN